VRIGVGLSTAPDARAAATEAALLARDPPMGATPTLAVLLTSPHYANHAQQVLDVVHELARPDALVGCVAEAVVAGRREFEHEPAVVVWLAVLPSAAETFHMEFLRTPTGGILGGYRFGRAGTDLHLLLPDPRTFPTHYLFAHLNTHAPGVTVMGGAGQRRRRAGTDGP
jgi:small ligand-binding sensory domain FIST